MSEAHKLPPDPDKLLPFKLELASLEYNIPEQRPLPPSDAGWKDAFRNPNEQLRHHIRDTWLEAPVPAEPKAEGQYPTFKDRLEALESQYDDVWISITDADEFFERADAHFQAHEDIAGKVARLLRSEVEVLKRVQSSEKVRLLYDQLSCSQVYWTHRLHPKVQEAFTALHQLAKTIGIAPDRPIIDYEEMAELGGINDDEETDDDGDVSAAV